MRTVEMASTHHVENEESPNKVTRRTILAAHAWQLFRATRHIDENFGTEFLTEFLGSYISDHTPDFARWFSEQFRMMDEDNYCLLDDARRRKRSPLPLGCCFVKDLAHFHLDKDPDPEGTMTYERTYRRMIGEHMAHELVKIAFEYHDDGKTIAHLIFSDNGGEGPDAFAFRMDEEEEPNIDTSLPAVGTYQSERDAALKECRDVVNDLHPSDTGFRRAWLAAPTKRYHLHLLDLVNGSMLDVLPDKLPAFRELWAKAPLAYFSSHLSQQVAAAMKPSAWLEWRKVIFVGNLSLLELAKPFGNYSQNLLLLLCRLMLICDFAGYLPRLDRNVIKSMFSASILSLNREQILDESGDMFRHRLIMQYFSHAISVDMVLRLDKPRFFSYMHFYGRVSAFKTLWKPAQDYANDWPKVEDARANRDWLSLMQPIRTFLKFVKDFTQKDIDQLRVIVDDFDWNRLSYEPLMNSILTREELNWMGEVNESENELQSQLADPSSALSVGLFSQHYP